MTAAVLVTQGYTLADVGTDHGYIPIYLLQQKKTPDGILEVEFIEMSIYILEDPLIFRRKV